MSMDLLVSPWLARHGVIKYAQYHQPPEYRTQATKLWDYLGADAISDGDGHVQLYVPSLKCIVNALNDPFYREVVVPDEDEFIFARSCMRTVGYEECLIVESQAVKSPGLGGI